jgi:PAS domain S-box-containing protein
VLVLNAYHLSHPWTEDLNRGLNEVFRSAAVEVDVWSEFLDARRHPGQARENEFEKHLATNYGTRRPDLLIAVDDDALRFLLERGDRLFPGIPVVFCGVSGEAEHAAALRRGWSGLKEAYDVEPWLDLALRLRRGNRQVVIVSDNTPANKLRRDGFRAAAARRTDFDAEFLDGESISLSEILDRLRQVPPTAIVIATTYSRTPDGRYVSPWSASKEMARASRAPILSPNGRSMPIGQGILADNANAGHSHGVEAGQIALKVLVEGAKGLGSTLHGPMAPVVDAAQLSRFGLLGADWPAGTVFVNRPDDWRNTYKEHQRLIWGATLLILVLFAIIAGLIINRRRFRRAQAELLLTRDQMERGQAIARLGTWDRNLRTGQLAWSDEVFRIYGLEPGAIEPSFDYIMSVIVAEDQPRIREMIASADRLRTGRRMEYRINRVDGELRHLRIRAEVQVNRRGDDVLMGTVQDVTEMREMEEKVRHAQRMESVGNLAGGVAHDFNNLLTVINGYSDVLLARLQGSDPARAHVSEIRKAGGRAAELTRNLLSFSRKQMIRPAPVDLNEAVLAMQGLLKPLLGENIGLHYQLMSGLPPAMVDRTQFEQSVMNLASNSRDAMESGGRHRHGYPETHV